jgi:hypothetical protein
MVAVVGPAEHDLGDPRKWNSALGLQAPERVARRLKRWVRPEKNAARWEASWTESVKASSLRSSSATWSEPNIWVMPTEARVVTREPRKRMASRVPHDGHC